MYFSEIYTFFFLDSFFHFLYLFKMWEIFMPHPVPNRLKDCVIFIEYAVHNLQMWSRVT